jgi:hypothetical protein
VLIRNGEFNQTAGNTGFIVTSDPWFEANLDQGALGDVQQGREASVNFDSYPGRSFNAIVDRVIPIVTFDTGGPATKTPVRPLGTGTPEWPATFKIRLRLEDAGVKFAPGMTGFARIARHRWALAISRDTVLSSGAGKGVVRVVDASNHLVATSVALGATDDKFVEITGGLDTSNWVLLNNPRSLRDNETINIARLTASQQAAKYGELTLNQRNALQAQLKDLQAKVELAQKNGELAASQRDALQVQLKESEAKAQQAQKNGELAASQRDALQAQLKDIQAKAEQAQAYAKVATWLRDALLAQLKDVQARGQLAQRNEQLALGKTNALQAQLWGAETKAEWAQENANFAKSQRDALQAQLKDLQAKVELTQKNGDLAASQRDAFQALLKESEAKAQQAQKNGELAANQRDALQAQLKDIQAKAQQAQGNEKLTLGQTNALQAQLKEAETKAEQAQEDAKAAASQRDALQAQLKDLQAKVELAQKNGELDQVQPNTGIGPSGDTEERPVASDPTPKTELATQDGHDSDSRQARSVRASSESKKGRHVMRHRTVARRQEGPLRAIDHWLHRHLASR